MRHIELNVERKEVRGYISLFFFVIAPKLIWGHKFLIKASRSHSDTPHSVVLLWTIDQPNAEVST
jgi:hypothetical protein